METIFYKKIGKGPACVLFHGWGFDHTVWLPFAENFKDELTFYLIDLPGMGFTPWMEWEIFSEEILKILPASFYLWGWSLGGLYATRFALENPSPVLALVNIASSPCFIQKENWLGIVPSVLDSMHTKLAEAPEQTLKDFVHLQGVSSLPLSTKPSLLGLKKGLEILHSWDLRQELKQLKMPVHYLFGRLDRIVLYPTLEQMQRYFPQFHYYSIAKAAHMPFLSTALEFNTLMHTLFLKSAL